MWSSDQGSASLGHLERQAEADSQAAFSESQTLVAALGDLQGILIHPEV